MIRPGGVCLVAVLLMASVACTGPEAQPRHTEAARPTIIETTATPIPPVPVTPTPPSTAPPAARLTVAEEKDGDSFVASDGLEYRVGMINTPERSECGGAAAADRAYALMAGGFTVEAYAVDDFGRTVARVLTDDGDLGVMLAREGLADDRYLDQFRHQHPAYADALTEAFAAASADQAGLWQTCWAGQPDGTRSEPVAPLVGITPGQHAGRTGQWPCHPDYVECIPDGPDLDCGEIGHQVRLFGQADPFRLDGNNTHATDGTGCDTYPEWSPADTYPYY